MFAVPNLSNMHVCTSRLLGTHGSGGPNGSSRKQSAAALAAAGSHNQANAAIGALLSTTDPDSWVGQRVQVASGRHAGQFGTVVSSGNGWVQIETAVGEVAKRAYELQVVSHTASSASHLDSGSQRNGSNKRARTSKTSSRGGDDSSVGGDSRARLFLGDTSDDNPGSLLLNLATSSDAGSSFRKNKRPRSYSDSLMTLSPSLLGDGNYFTFRNPFSPTSSGTSASSSLAAVTGLLGSLPDDDSDVFSLSNKSYLHSHRAALNNGSGSMYSATQQRAPIRPSAFIEAKKSYISKYVQRHSQKISNRPNLVDWKQQLDAALVTDALFERQAARAFDESHCDVCSLDKWPGAKFCWNECCPISPIYFKLTGETRVSSAAASVCAAPDVEVFPTQSAMEVDSQASFSRVSSMADLEAHFGPARTALTLRPNGPVANRANEYLLHLPAKILGTPCARSTNTGPFSAHAEGSPRGVGPTIQPFSLMQGDGQSLVDMVPRKRPSTGGYDPMRNAVSYTQYFHGKTDRSDSFAGGETDTEVPGSPVTVL